MDDYHIAIAEETVESLAYRHYIEHQKQKRKEAQKHEHDSRTDNSHNLSHDCRD